MEVEVEGRTTVAPLRAAVVEVPSTPSEAEPDPIFGYGLAFLTGKGVKERAARGFLGLLRKEVGDLVTGELLATAEREDVSDPLGWLRAAATRRGAGKAKRLEPEDPSNLRVVV